MPICAFSKRKKIQHLVTCEFALIQIGTCSNAFYRIFRGLKTNYVKKDAKMNIQIFVYQIAKLKMAKV